MATDPGLGPLPDAVVAGTPRRRLSPVWIIPILAALVAIGIAVQQILAEGPTINITFSGAPGVEAGKTFIKYKDVNIGQVTGVHLTDDFRKVRVTAQIDKSAAGLMVEDAKFWVVEPRVTLSGVSGLGTLLSGNYIGFEAGKSGERERDFVGLDIVPVVSGQAGRRFTLRADTLGSLGIGSPIYFRRLPVGQVAAYELAPDGRSVNITAFVDAPYDRFVHRATRFWNVSGVDVSAGATGVQVRTESLVALLVGGLAFDTPDFADDAQPAAADDVFMLYPDRATAMKAPEGIRRRFVLHFNESVRGLSVGAPVMLLGIAAGEVTDIGLQFDRKTLDLRPRVEFVFFPERIVARLAPEDRALGTAVAEQIAGERQKLLKRLFEERGLRAQLRTGSLLTGQQFVAFDYFPDAKKVAVDLSAEPAELPVAPSTLPDLEAKVTNILVKLDKIPFEAIGKDVRKTLESANTMLQEVDRAVKHIDRDVTPELKSSLEELRRVAANADKVMKGVDATLLGRDAPALQELRDALQEVARAARSVRVLTDYLERHPDALIRGRTGGDKQ
jgi:paraquat-inducible protein B